jgi:hypothetical protein
MLAMTLIPNIDIRHVKKYWKYGNIRCVISFIVTWTSGRKSLGIVVVLEKLGGKCPSIKKMCKFG